MGVNTVVGSIVGATGVGISIEGGATDEGGVYPLVSAALSGLKPSFNKPLYCCSGVKLGSTGSGAIGSIIFGPPPPPGSIVTPVFT